MILLATVKESKAYLTASIKDVAKLNKGLISLTPALHIINVCFTAHEANSLDVYDLFGDWLEGLALFIREQVAAAWPCLAFPLFNNPRPALPYTYNITLISHSNAPSGKAPLRLTQLNL